MIPRHPPPPTVAASVPREPIKTHTTFTATRVTIRSVKPFKQVGDAIEDAICQREQVKEFLNQVEDMTVDHLEKKEKRADKKTMERYTKAAQILIGKHKLHYLSAFENSWWIPLFNVDPAYNVAVNGKTLRMGIGNPLIAAQLLSRNVNISLFFPLDILVKEMPGTGTQIEYMKPTDMIGATVDHIGTKSSKDPAIMACAMDLDRILEDFVMRVLS